MSRFESFLAPQLQQYIAYRKHLGYAKNPTISYLRTFDRYLKQKNTDCKLLQPSFFLELRKDLKVEPRTFNAILYSLRGFFKFMVRRAYYIQNPLKDIPPCEEGFIVPFVFSPEQTNQLLAAACKGLRKTRKNLLTDMAVYLALVLLARCGMRISEPTHLLLTHYRAEEKTLYIEKTKFKKDRLIPIPASVAVEIENYLAVRKCFSPTGNNPFLLAGKAQQPLRAHQLRATFHKAVRDIGLYQARQILGNMTFSAPTPHSLRHSFAVNTLITIKERGLSPQHALPVLAAYMGHSKYKHTVVYLKLLDAEQRKELAAFVDSRHDAP
jgi:site-specific recombinase XerD